VGDVVGERVVDEPMWQALKSVFNLRTSRCWVRLVDSATFAIDSPLPSHYKHGRDKTRNRMRKSHTG
jgi:hypothetical protein